MRGCRGRASSNHTGVIALQGGTKGEKERDLGDLERSKCEK